MNHQTRKSRSRVVLLGTAGLALLSTALAPALQAETLPVVPPHTQSGLDETDSFTKIAAASKPSVVTITTVISRQQAEADSGQQESPQQMPFDEFFRQFFGQQGNPFGMPQQQQQDQTARALGSGFVVSKDGLIVTNNHVVAGAKSIKVTLDDGSSFDGKVVGTDPKTDLAVIKIDAKRDLVPLPWGDSGKVQAGNRVIAIGNPFGVGVTVTEGIVSALGRDLHSGPYDDFLQVDAAINHGNSGGPLIDTDGNVIGINAAIYSPNDGNVGLGFAIPSDMAKTIVQKIVENGSVTRGYLGVQIQPVTDDMASALGLKDKKGAIVVSVEPDTPAAKAGLKQGDVVLTLNGNPIDSAKALSASVASLAPGDKAQISVWRDGKTMDETVTLAAMPTADQSQDTSPKDDNGGTKVPHTDFSVSALTPQLRQQLNLDADQKGVVVTSVDPNSDQNDLETGDVILAVNSVDVNTPEDLTKALDSARKDGRNAALLLIMRGGNRAFLALPLAGS